jgi:hypothetical protein
LSPKNDRYVVQTKRSPYTLNPDAMFNFPMVDLILSSMRQDQPTEQKQKESFWGIWISKLEPT